MQLVLSFILISTLGLAMQTCDKSSIKAAKTEKETTATNSIVNTNTVASAPAHSQAEEDAPRISLEEAKKDYDAGKAIIVDSRSEEGYKLERIKDSINVPLADFEATYKRIPTDKKIIVYCS